MHAALGERNAQHEYGLQNTPKARELNPHGDHLEHRAARAHKDAVERAIAQHGSKRVKSARKAFRQRKGHQDHRKTQEHLRVGKTVHFIKAQEHKANG